MQHLRIFESITRHCVCPLSVTQCEILNNSMWETMPWPWCIFGYELQISCPEEPMVYRVFRNFTTYLEVWRSTVSFYSQCNISSWTEFQSAVPVIKTFLFFSLNISFCPLTFFQTPSLPCAFYEFIQLCIFTMWLNQWLLFLGQVWGNLTFLILIGLTWIRICDPKQYKKHCLVPVLSVVSIQETVKLSHLLSHCKQFIRGPQVAVILYKS